MKTTISLRHFLLALAVVAVWGTNFVVIKLALDQLPPLLFATLRFVLVLLPMVFFLARPKVPWHNLAGYGLLIGVGQFGLLYIAMNGQISPGLASLVLQVQVFFTIALSMLLSHERLQRMQWLALAMASTGLVIIMLHTDGDTTLLGLAMALLAALCWAGGNIVARSAGRVNMVAYVVWSSLFAVPPLLVLSLLVEGPSAFASSWQTMDLSAWAAVAWQAWANSLFGYAVWGWLLARYPAATITPMALLVPLFGMGAAALWLGEGLPAWKLAAAALVLGGLALNLLWPQWRRWLRSRRLPAPL